MDHNSHGEPLPNYNLKRYSISMKALWNKTFHHQPCIEDQDQGQAVLEMTKITYIELRTSSWLNLTAKASREGILEAIRPDAHWYHYG